MECNYCLILNNMTNNFIFIHIPKTAGRSVLSAIGMNFTCQHIPMIKYIDDLSEDVVKSLFKFTVVRNPWERAVSYYRCVVLGKSNNILPFDDWIIQFGSHNIPKYKNFNIVPLDGLSYCKNSNGEVLIDKFLKFESIDSDIATLPVDIVKNQLPNIGEGEELLCYDRVEYLKDINICDINYITNKSTNYRDLYTSQQSIDIIAGLNQQLISMFNYTY